VKYILVLSLGFALTAVGCKPVQTYEWGNYEGSLYVLMKDPSSLDKYGHALDRQIHDGEGFGKVPPGIYAEYGYFLQATNQPGEAMKYFEKEKQRWPESSRFMDKMILNCKSPKPAPSIPPPPAAPTSAPEPAPGAPPAPAPEAVLAPAKELR
jgi:hypothetical protein